MNIFTSYSAKVKTLNKVLDTSASMYCDAIQFFMDVCLNEWETLCDIKGIKFKQSYVESITIPTTKHKDVKYDFNLSFYKVPCYLRRAAINAAIGKVSSYKSNLANWESEDSKTRGKRPSLPSVNREFPVMYKGNMFMHTGKYTARIKVYIRNTWDWIDIELKKSDMDYIYRYCNDKTEHAPTLRKRGKEWFLDFPFEEKVTLNETDLLCQKVLSVDLGINNACTCSVMDVKGAVLERDFYKLSRENDSLLHAIGHIKRAQRHGANRTPRLWARAKGINDNIAVKTANFIVETAITHGCDVIVMEHLDVSGKKHGSKKQRLHMWKAKYVQAMVTDKAHRNGIHISHVNAWGTSRLAYDGSGRVLRGRESEKTGNSYSICEFQNGKIYNCDLNATYNIGAKYFIRYPPENPRTLGSWDEWRLQYIYFTKIDVFQ